MTDTPRPFWDSTEMSEANFRRIYEHGTITAVKARSEMTGVDTSREWLEVTNAKGKTVRLPHAWEKVLRFVGYATNPGLFAYTYAGERMRDRLRQIDAWEQKHAQERAEYERLRAKFEGGSA